ncbi:AAA family ATPase [Halorubrum saccharovorum]|uniref:AAA family ATPase n=1 Tax=Halorubrum saccharovorum TaxID=2248 RepID=UPI0009B5CFAC|nr:AAA family ATPase [Halorubrum saccharovorum]
MSDGRVPIEERHTAFVQALDSYIVDTGSPDVPFEVELKQPLPEKIRTFLLSLTHSTREGEFNVQPIEPEGDGKLDTNVESFVLLAGYNDQKDVFAIWDAYLQQEFSYSQTIQIKESTLDKALRDGVGRQKRRLKKTPRTEVALAARPDSLDDALIERYKRTQIRSIIDDHFPKKWKNSASKHYKIEETVVQFLEEYNSEKHSISERRKFAQEAVAEDENVKLETVQSKCNEDLKKDSGAGNTLTDVFDDRLKQIEETWKDLERSKSESTVVESPETDTVGPQHSNGTWDNVDNLIDSTSSPSQPDGLYFPQKENERPVTAQIDDAIRSGKHVIITGPPGSGKTALAEYICRHYVSDNYTIATATADWSTFDTIGGYRPKSDGQLEFKPGVFLQRLLDPSVPESKNEWLVLDELNRADIAKAFGSLFSALTKRNISLSFDIGGYQVMLYGNPASLESTPITSYNYYIPADWRLLATMNTVDKSSLYRMGYAFMRRFAFISVPVPDADQISSEIVERYIDCWDDVDIPDSEAEIWPEAGIDDDVSEPAEQVYKDLSILWEVLLNDDGYEADLTIGPGLIKDTLQHTLSELNASGELDYGNAFAAHILPQLEGVPIGTATDIINQLHGRIEANSSGMSQFSKEVPNRTAKQMLSNV